MTKNKRKSRKRQTDPAVDDTGSSDDDLMAGKQCTHLARGINISQLRRVVKSGLSLTECEACQKAKDVQESSDAKENAQHDSGPRDEEQDEETEMAVSVWICLQCGNRGCGRNQQKHALHHYETPRSDPHTLAVNTSSWATWCYKCDDYVFADSKRLTEAVEFLRKQAGLSGKAPTVLRRSTSLALGESQPEEKDIRDKTAEKSKEMVKDDKKKTETDDVLGCLPRVKGLVNLGNTCFMNSILQVLSQTHLLTQLLDLHCREGQILHLKGGVPIAGESSASSQEADVDSGVGSIDRDSPEDTCTTEPIEVILGSAKALTLSLSSFIKEMHCPAASTSSKRNSQSTVTPSNIYNQVCKKSPQFRGFEQQDAHELLRHLLDGIRNEDIIRHRQGLLRYFNLPERNNPADIEPALRQKIKAYGRESNHTFIDSVFGGILLSTIICQTCKTPYQMLEPFMDLSLPITEEKTPPSSKRKLDGFDCLSPASPVQPRVSKHQLKKERKTKKVATRKGVKTKEKSQSETKEEENDKIVDQEREEEKANEEEKEEVDDNSEEKKTIRDESEETKDQEMEVNGEVNSDEQKVKEDQNEKEGPKESMKDEEEETDKFDVFENSAAESSSELSDADVEDNTVDDLDRQIEELSISSPSTDDSAENYSHSKSPKHQKWTARSLCTLSPRYHSESSQDFSIESCLNVFTAAELLTGNNKYGCEACTKQRGNGKTVYSMATKQLLVLAPPAILTLQLKRFTSSGLTLRKVQRKVQFPLLLDLAPFCSAAAADVSAVSFDQKQVLYSLYGVVEHSGRLSSGHYTAYVKVRPLNPSKESMTRFMQTSATTTSDLEKLRSAPIAEPQEESSAASKEVYNPAGKWYYVSDSQVTEVSQERVLNSQAFLLFYERIA